MPANFKTLIRTEGQLSERGKRTKKREENTMETSGDLLSFIVILLPIISSRDNPLSHSLFDGCRK